MEQEKLEIRFMIRKDIYEEMKEEAESADVPLASYTKVCVKNGRIKKWKKKKE